MSKKQLKEVKFTYIDEGDERKYFHFWVGQDWSGFKVLEIKLGSKHITINFGVGGPKYGLEYIENLECKT